MSKLVGDLRYSAKFTGSNEELNVFVFLEHQSRPDPLMAFRLLEYVVAAYRQYVPSLTKGRRFPFPLAVVLHHGPRPWKKIPSMRDLIDPAPGLPSDILNLPICLIDAATLPLDDLHGHPVVCALLDSLQSASTGQLPERVATVFSRLQNVLGEGRLRAYPVIKRSKITIAQFKCKNAA